MKFSEDILKEFDLSPRQEKEPVNIMQVSEMLDFMKVCADRIVRKSERYIKTEDADEQLDCMDIVTAKLNDFVQVFKDLIIFLRKEEGTYKGGESLRYCMSSYDTFEFGQTEMEAYCKECELLERYVNKNV